MDGSSLCPNAGEDEGSRSLHGVRGKPDTCRVQERRFASLPLLRQLQFTFAVGAQKILAVPVFSQKHLFGKLEGPGLSIDGEDLVKMARNGVDDPAVDAGFGGQNDERIVDEMSAGK